MGLGENEGIIRMRNSEQEQLEEQASDVFVTAVKFTKLFKNIEVNCLHRATLARSHLTRRGDS